MKDGNGKNEVADYSLPHAVARASLMDSPSLDSLAELLWSVPSFPFAPGRLAPTIFIWPAPLEGSHDKLVVH